MHAESYKHVIRFLEVLKQERVILLPDLYVHLKASPSTIRNIFRTLMDEDPSPFTNEAAGYHKPNVLSITSDDAVDAVIVKYKTLQANSRPSTTRKKKVDYNEPIENIFSRNEFKHRRVKSTEVEAVFKHDALTLHLYPKLRL